MKNETPTPSRARILADAEALEGVADDLERDGQYREALEYRSEADALRAEPPQRYTVQRNVQHVLWDLLEDGSPVGGFYLEATARAVAHACNVYDVAGLNGAADVAALRRLHVEKLERQLSEIRAALDAERRQARSNIVDGQRFGG